MFYNCVMDRGSFDELLLATVEAMGDSDTLPPVLPGVPSPDTSYLISGTYTIIDILIFTRDSS